MNEKDMSSYPNRRAKTQIFGENFFCYPFETPFVDDVGIEYTFDEGQGPDRHDDILFEKTTQKRLKSFML